MDVLKRRMFQAGGVVGLPEVPSKVLSKRIEKNLTRRVPFTEIIQIEQQGDLFYERTYDRNGKFKSERLIDRNFSATGDIQEALERQKTNEMVEDLVGAVPYVLGGGIGGLGVKAALGTTAGKQFLKGAGSTIEKGAKGLFNLIAPYKLNPKFVRGQDGKSKLLERGAAENFPPQSLSQIQMKPVTTGLYGVGATSAAVEPISDALTTTPEEVQEQFEQQVLDSDMSELEKMRAIESAKAQKDPVAYAQSIADFDADLDAILEEETPKVATTTSDNNTGDDTGDDTGNDSGNDSGNEQGNGGVTAAQTTANSLSNFFSSSAFNDALRNIGGSLVREGRFGAGLAAGAAGFADEQEAKSLLEQERKSEFEKFLLEKSLAGDGMDFGDLAKVGDVGEGVNEAIRNFEGTNASIGIMNDLIALFEEAQEKNVPVTGLEGRLERFKDEASAFLGIEKEASTATKIQNMINIVKNRQIRELLGESGRTISNLDREIVDKVFGQISFTDLPSESLKKLKEARGTLQSSAKQYQRNVKTGAEQLRSKQAGNIGQTYISEYGDLINDVLNIDVDKIITSGYNPTVGARVVKIKLRGE